MDEGKAASEKAPKRPRAAWWVEMLFAAFIVLIVVGAGMQAYNLKKTNARRTEAKQGLHEIQLAVEKFAVDTGGTYPEYLIGGSAPRGDNPEMPFMQASDPLIRKGFLTSYPRNPFAVPKTVQAMQEKYHDPYRPGTSESQYGYRFGEDYTLMGQVLADFRYPKALIFDGKKLTSHKSYADFGYPFWDIWPPGAMPKPFLPGEFFYKAAGILIVPNEENVRPDVAIVPTISEFYLLGLYGAPHDRGKDVLGAEPVVFLRPKRLPDGTQAQFDIPAWTRSTNTPDKDGNYQGSVFGVYKGEGDDQLGEGNPNGIPDGIIMMVGTCYPE